MEKITAAARQRRREKRKSSSAIFLFLFSIFFFDSWGFSALTRKRKGKEEEVFDVKYLILAEKDVKVTALVSFFFLFFTFVEINTKSKNWQWNFFVLFILFFFICGRSRSYFFLLFFWDSTFWRLADFSAHETLPSCDRIVFSPEIKWIWFFLYRCKNEKKRTFFVVVVVHENVETLRPLLPCLHGGTRKQLQHGRGIST